MVKMTDSEARKCHVMREQITNRVREYVTYCIMNNQPVINQIKELKTKKKLTQEEQLLWENTISAYKKSINTDIIWILQEEFDIPNMVSRAFGWNIPNLKKSIFDIIVDFYLEHDRFLQPSDKLFDDIVEQITYQVLVDHIDKGFRLKTSRSKAYLSRASNLFI